MILGDGTLEITPTPIFSLNRGPFLQKKNASVAKITFFNTAATAETAILYIRKANTTPIRELRQFVLQQNEGGEYLEPGEVLDLQNGDELQAETTTASAVNFIVVGERTL